MNTPPTNLRQTKIIATLGPASSDERIIGELVRRGVDVLRLNFSHGTHEQHAANILKIRRQQKRFGRPVAILGDLQGPKIRIGTLPAPVSLAAKATLRLVPGKTSRASSGALPVVYPRLLDDIRPGETILIDDGRVELRVIARERDALKVLVVRGGKVSDHKGVNFPDATLTLPALTSKDLQDLRFAVDHGVDFLALSFVRRPEDVEAVRRRLRAHGSTMPIVAKIEKPQAVDRIDEILAQADGIMVARGDLGVEVPYEQVPLIQKRLIHLANMQGKTVITATQMLETMIASPTPTRAEVSDVANAVFDGTDAVMLSGETAAGAYPVEAFEKMSVIARCAESSGLIRGTACYQPSDGGGDHSSALAHAAVDAAVEGGLQGIVVFTMTGRTARLLSKRKPPVPVFALTPDPVVLARMCLWWGIRPVQARLQADASCMIRHASQLLRSQKLLGRGARVAILAGVSGVAGSSNLIKIHSL